MPLLKATSYSTCVAAAVMGAPQRGIIHSAFAAAANIVFPDDFVLSLNAASSTYETDPAVMGAIYKSSPRMPNGLQLSATSGCYPFSTLHTGLPVLFGAQRLHIEAIGCSLDLSLCSQWSPHIERPEVVDVEIVRKNRERLVNYVEGVRVPQQGASPSHLATLASTYHQRMLGLPSENDTFPSIHVMAQSLCGRGVGLTPAGDDMLAGWMAAGWLLYGSEPGFVEACQQIVAVAKLQTHLLSQCWLRYAAEGNVAEPVCALLEALTQDDEQQLFESAEAVLALGATSGRDVISGMLLLLNSV